jgi:ribosome maturation factor RimP
MLPLQQHNDTKEGNEGRSLLLFPNMINETLVGAISGMIESIIESNKDYFLVEVKIKPTNNVKVFLDGDSGIPIGKCAEYNRALYKLLEESGLFPADDFSLEVSSPGLDEPLKLARQYKKNIGRDVEVTTTDGNKVEGRLLSADGSVILVEEEKGKNKKKQIILHTIPSNDIKSTKIQIKF